MRQMNNWNSDSTAPNCASKQPAAVAASPGRDGGSPKCAPLWNAPPKPNSRARNKSGFLGPAAKSRFKGLFRQAVECEIQRHHVDPRFAKHTQIAATGVVSHQLA